MRPEGRTHRLLVIGVALVSVAAGAFVIQRSVQGRDNAAANDPAASASVIPSEGISATTEPSLEPSLTPSASPSPSKKPSQKPLPPRTDVPIPAGFPTKQTTGWQHTGVTLSPVNGIYYASTAGEVLDSKDFTGGIVVRANNVTIKRSRVKCGTTDLKCPGIWVEQQVRGTTIEDVEVTSKSKTERIDRGITAGKTWDLTIRRTLVHETQRGIEYGYTALIEDSYVDDQYNPTDAHVSAVGGNTNKGMKLVIRHNWIAGKLGNNNSGALLFYPGGEFPQVVDITSEQNIVNGGTYSMWLSSHAQMTGSVTVRSNLFGTKYSDLCGAYNTHFIDNLDKVSGMRLTWEGNYWYAPGMAKDGKEVTKIIKY